ncbi:endonuclease V [Halanaeroarchaeum sulfurireducens]|uniref:Endonuclease V (Deoxyinosine 3'endonuclease) n=1 Tax=Halanaeroarchaeum sulfurireducens TaxID=1604004 RepID=A0A0N9N869_9EURY|nr:endonuclease V [Halanaeroarchaeum sulfurireducens]ALG81558.1 endonuclease V (deoxyinosine 3'endonuclease) [Halanaeroarchaeum sulfurireducens]
MDVVRTEYLPDPSLDQAEMKAQQRDIAADATFEDDGAVDPAALRLDEPIELPDGDPPRSGAADAPIVVGVDQAFTDGTAISAAIAVQSGSVVGRSIGRAPLEIPYIPGLLAYREAGAIVDALESLTVDPSLLMLDGSGRIHYRQAGIATHVGVLFDVPAVGVAKSLLCGGPARSLENPLPDGTRVPILADGSVEAPDGTVIGHAYQSRQFPTPARRHVNPLIVSPGHRVSATTTVETVAALAAGYKLPEPTRLADRAVDVAEV